MRNKRTFFGVVNGNKSLAYQGMSAYIIPGNGKVS